MTPNVGTPLPAYSRLINRGFVFISLLSLILPLPFAPRHDYSAYTGQWANTLAGGSPWFFESGAFSGNAYGPLFNVFAPLYGIYSHLPHLIFTLVWILLSRFLLNRIASTLTEKEKAAHFIFYFLNPFFLITVVSYGHFDIVVAACCVAGIVLTQAKREWRAGLALAAGVLLKFYPLLLVPFLGYERKQANQPAKIFHIRLILVFIALVAAGMMFSYCLYGDTIFAPFTFGKDRMSSFLSFFRFLRSPESPTGSLDHLSLPLMALSAFGIGFLYLIRPRDALYSIICALYLVFLFYKVANPQFYTVLFYLVPLWIHEAKQKKQVILPSVYWALYLPLFYCSFSYFLYIFTQGYKNHWLWIETWISVPFFFIQMGCFFILIRELIHHKQGDSRPTDQKSNQTLNQT